MHTSSYLRNAIVTVLFLAVLVTPFIVANVLFFPFITGKAFFFRFCIQVAAFLYLFLVLKDSSVRPRKTVLLYAIAFFVVVVTVADLLGVDPSRSFWSNFERMDGLLSVLHLALFALMAGSLFTEKTWKRFWIGSLIASSLMCLYAFLQIFGAFVINQGGVRVDALLGNAIYLAVYVLFNLFIAAYLFFRTQGSARWAYLIPLILNGVVLIYTGTRGAVIGLVVGAGIAAAGSIFSSSEQRVRVAGAGALALLVFLVGTFVLIRKTDFVQRSPILSRFANISLSDQTTRARFMIWGMAIEGWKEHPILGWGQENFNLVFNKYYNPKLYDQEQWFDRAHSVLFDWLIAGGMLGLLAYLGLFGAAFFVLYRSSTLSRIDKMIIGGLLVGYFIQNLTVFDNLVSGIYFMAFLAYLHSHASEVSFRAPAAAPSLVWSPSPTLRDGLLSLGGILFVVTCYFVDLKPALAANAIIGGLSKHEEGITKNIEYFQKAIGYDTLGTGEAREQLTQVAFQSFSVQGLDTKTRSDLVGLAESEMADQLATHPGDARYALFLGDLYMVAGDLGNALPTLEKASQLSPGKQTILYELGRVYITSGNTAKGLETFKKAYDLEPSAPHSISWYAAALVYSKKVSEAKQFLLEKRGDLLATDDRVATALAAIGDYATLEQYWNKRLAEDPQSKNAYTTLAAVELHLGKREQAIALLSKLPAVDPSLKGEVDKAIAEIRAGRNPLGN